jgi:hypothetical protein
MNIEDRIKMLAEEFAAQSQSQASHLKAQLLDAERKVAEIKAKLDATKLAFKRLANFQVIRGLHYQCARCGVFDGLQADMTPRPGRHRLDLFQCDTCRFEMEVPH